MARIGARGVVSPSAVTRERHSAPHLVAGPVRQSKASMPIKLSAREFRIIRAGLLIAAASVALGIRSKNTVRMFRREAGLLPAMSEHRTTPGERGWGERQRAPLVQNSCETPCQARFALSIWSKPRLRRARAPQVTPPAGSRGKW